MAIKYFEEALLIDREIGDQRGESKDLGNLGTAYGDLGDLRKAIECFDEALIIKRKIGDQRGEANSLTNSALVLHSLGDRAQAIHRAEVAIKIFEAIEDPNAAKVRAKLAEWRAAKP
jgi:tetratricopeptide (TPR) repeat protein